MSQMQWLYMILLGELVVILALVLAIVLIVGMRRRGRDRQAAATLASRVKQGEPEREKLLRKELSERLGLEGPALDAKIQQLLSAEQAFYEQLMLLYVKRDTELAKRLPERVDDLVRPYREIEAPKKPLEPAEAAAPSVATATGSAASDEEDIPVSATPAVLLERTRRLAQDVTAYRQTLNRLFAEYTAMFGVQIDESKELSAQEVMERLETGQLAGADDVAPGERDG